MGARLDWMQRRLDEGIDMSRVADIFIMSDAYKEGKKYSPGVIANLISRIHVQEIINEEAKNCPTIENRIEEAVKQYAKLEPTGRMWFKNNGYGSFCFDSVFICDNYPVGLNVLMGSLNGAFQVNGHKELKRTLVRSLVEPAVYETKLEALDSCFGYKRKGRYVAIVDHTSFMKNSRLQYHDYKPAGILDFGITAGQMKGIVRDFVRKYEIRCNELD